MTSQPLDQARLHALHLEYMRLKSVLQQVEQTLESARQELQAEIDAVTRDLPRGFAQLPLRSLCAPTARYLLVDLNTTATQWTSAVKRYHVAANEADTRALIARSDDPNSPAIAVLDKAALTGGRTNDRADGLLPWRIIGQARTKHGITLLPLAGPATEIPPFRRAALLAAAIVARKNPTAGNLWQRLASHEIMTSRLEDPINEARAIGRRAIGAREIQQKYGTIAGLLRTTNGPWEFEIRNPAATTVLKMLAELPEDTATALWHACTANPLRPGNAWQNVRREIDHFRLKLAS